jgi:hypothetical protein
MIREKVVAAAMAIVLSATPSAAKDYGPYVTGEDLNKICQEYLRFRHSRKANASAAFECLGYVLGVTDTLVDALCLPDGVESGTLADVVAQYLDQHPAEHAMGGNFLIRSALTSAYSCPKKD